MSKVKFTVPTYHLCIGFSEICSCPAHNFVVTPASGMVRYRNPVFHPSVRMSHQGAILLKSLKAGASVSYGHISVLVTGTKFSYSVAPVKTCTTLTYKYFIDSRHCKLTACFCIDGVLL